MGTKNLAAMIGICFAGSLLSLRVLEQEVQDMSHFARDITSDMISRKISVDRATKKWDDYQKENNLYVYSSVIAGLVFAGIAGASTYKLKNELLRE